MAVSYLNDGFFGRLETLALSLRSYLTGFFGGKHLVRTYGQTVEFADYREYMLGDDIRRIDWNLYSRFEKYFLKLFTDERQMHVRVYLDCSASMGKTNPKKAAYAIGVAAALGFLSVHNTDKVSYRLLRKDTAEDPFGTLVGKTSFFKAISDLENTEFGDDTDLASSIINCPDSGTNDGLAVIVSDFFTESDWKKAVDYLSYKKQQVLLVQVLAPEEIDPALSGRVSLIDVESDDLADERNMKIPVTRSLQIAYEEALNEMVSDIKSFAASREAGFVQLQCDRPIEKELFGKLMKAGVMS